SRYVRKYERWYGFVQSLPIGVQTELTSDESQHSRRNDYRVPIAKAVDIADPLLVHEGAITAAEIQQPVIRAHVDDLRMIARDPWVVEHELVVGRTANRQFPIVEQQLLEE